MKVFISADIEGITTSTRWDETNPSHSSFRVHGEQMSKEVLAACQGAIAAGATEITVKDAHGNGCNIDPTILPKEATLIRSGSGCPELMVQGINSSFDAAMFVGYHSAAGRPGNPMSHTINTKHSGIWINGRLASEFFIYSYAAAMYGVPVVFLSGDRMLCEDEGELHPKLLTVAVKDGFGSATFCRSVEATIPEIRATSETACRQDLSQAKIQLPDSFEIEVRYNDPGSPIKASYFPDVKQCGDLSVSFFRKNYYEVLRTLLWII